MSLLKKEYHTRIYFLGLCLMAVGIPLSRFTMSVAGLLLFGNWLFEGNLKRKISLFLRNKPALVFASLFLLHVIGLTYTSDFNYAIKDLRTKVPLFIFPLIFSSTPAISGAKFAKILKFYLLSVLGGTMAGVFILLTRVVTDPRELSPFISHIRFSLNVCLAITVILYLLIINTKEITLPWRYFLFTLLAWMFTYLYISQSFTGFFVMIALVLAWLIVASTRLPVPWVKESLILLAIAIPVVLFLYIRSDYKHYFNISSENISKLEWVTPGGHYYYHDPNDKVLVNGHRIWIFVCEDELREAWEKRSRIPYDSLGQSGLKISDVLLRYLTSRGLRKDAGGVKQLSDNEIKRIEEGIADIEETRGSPLHRRLSKIFWEYQNYRLTGDPSGHSVMMRLDYWKASMALIQKHLITGVGTGDMNRVFDQYYNEINSKLKPEWRRRSHNQFLSITVGFGILGLTWFLFSLIYPPVVLKKLSNFLFGSFFLLVFMSMIPEDTIESQEGVTFVAFFFSFLLFANEEKSD